jgi:hypothetical protein
MGSRRSHILTLLVIGIVAVCITRCALAQQATPKLNLTFTQPAEGARLQGKVDVRVTVEPAAVVPGAMYVALGAPPWMPMMRVGETAEWQATLDTTLWPNGERTLSVRAWSLAGKSQTSTKVVLDNGLRCFFGDLHAHTSYSDGALFPADAYAYAREVARLDFFCLTDHLESLDADEWADSREQGWKANQEGAFVAFPGLEWSKTPSHACIYDPPSTDWPSDAAGLYAALAKAGVIAKFNHPTWRGAQLEIFDGLKYSEVGDSVMQLMECRSDEEQDAFIRALNLGWHLAPDGSDDTHSPDWGQNGTWTAVLAPGLSRTAIWDALRRRHCYSTRDRNCRLFFWVNGAVMGDIVKAIQPPRSRSP